MHPRLLIPLSLSLLVACTDEKAGGGDSGGAGAEDGAADGGEGTDVTDGADGTDGATDGTDGGTDGTDGGTDGTDGGTDGTDGATDGTDGGTDGTDGGTDGTDGGTDGGPAEDFALNGNWADSAGGDHTITNTSWTSYLGSQIVNLSTFDNATRYAVGQNDAASAFNPGLWSRFDWTKDGADNKFFCLTVAAAASEAEALAATPADGADLMNGCNGMAWTGLIPAAPPPSIEIAGLYDGSDGSVHDIRATEWIINSSYSYRLTTIENSANFAIAQNMASNPSGGGLWSRFDWTVDTSGVLYMCHTASTAADEGAAFGAPPPAAAEPAVSGCNGAAWVRLTTAT